MKSVFTYYKIRVAIVHSFKHEFFTRFLRGRLYSDERISY